MAEVLVVLPALTQLLEQAFRVLGRLRRAHERQKTLVEVFKRHERELNDIKIIIGIIDDEKDLQTANVASKLVRLEEVQCKLVKLLEELDPKSKGKINQFARQLTQGSSDEKKLSAIMDEVGHLKSTLLLRIQVASVGVMRDMEKRLVANAEVIERIDQFLREELDNWKGLKIARLLKGRRPSDNGTVPLTPADLRFLISKDDGSDDYSTDETVVEDSDSSSDSEPTINQAKMERIVLHNSAKDQALQINAAIGQDIWSGINRLVIKHNVAENQAVQVNYGAPLEALSYLLDRQDQRMTAPRQPGSRENRAQR